MTLTVDEKKLKEIRARRSAVALLHLELAHDQAELNLLVARAIDEAGGDLTADEIDEQTGEVRRRLAQL